MKKVIIIICILLSGCASNLKIINVEGQPQECNDMYTMMEYSLKFRGAFKKESHQLTAIMTLITTWASKCDAARQRQK